MTTTTEHHQPESSARPTGASARASGRPSASGRILGLDGLRAVAIVAVLVFHLNAAWLPGGYLGVDVFFVVSGFLITTLLVREHRANGRVDLANFWTRRARRLLPALFVTVAVSVLVARLASSDLLVQVGRQMVGALTFSTNWIEIASGSSYFDQTAPHLFMNFWSLAVEEQFYLLWPLATIGLLRLARPTMRIGVALSLAVGSTLLMALLFEPGADATRVYYGTDTHLMGLMIGAALAFAWASPGIAARLRPSSWGVAGRYAAPAAVIVLLALFWLLDDGGTWTFRGGILLASVATGVIVLGLLDRSRHETRLQRVLDSPAARWIGERSYAIYLWHWPVILVIGNDNPSVPGTASHLWTRLWCVVVTLALADLTYRFIETPVRRHGFRGVAGALRDWWEVNTPLVRRSAAAFTVLAVGTIAAIIVTAPKQSQTAEMLAANAAAAQSRPSVASTLDPDDAGRVVAETAATAGSAGSATAPATKKATPTSAPVASAKATFTMPAGKDIDAYGDSMMVGSVHALDYYFPGIRMDAKSNRRWSDGLAAITAKGAGNRRAVVLAFGTNAGTDPETIEKIIATLGPNRMVILVNLMGPFSRIEDDNAALAAIAAKHDNVTIADWAKAVSGHPEQLQSDRIHPSLKGSHLFAKTVRQALADLSEKHTGVKPVLKELPSP